MHQSFAIQPLSNIHSPRVVDLILPIQQQEFNVPITLDGQPDLVDIETAYYGDGGHFWGAVENGTGQLLGTIALISIGHNAGALRKMFVRKDYRGKEFGIAQRLMETLIAYCEKKNIFTIYLGTIHSMKAAHRFYERNGFTTISKADLPGYYPNMSTDNLYYYRTLDKPTFHEDDRRGRDSGDRNKAHTA
jgi:GNAT superfamily N-acetyltransferase